MGMTMRVYEIDSKTGAVVREHAGVTVAPEDENDAPPLLSSAYPPCKCPRCRRKENGT